MNWIVFDTPRQLTQITERSHHVPCLIFKHSTRCSISSVAKYRLESDWTFSSKEIEPYFLDILSNRNISNGIAGEYGVTHESPQVLIIWKGECVYDTSHLDISADSIREVMEATDLA